MQIEQSNKKEMRKVEEKGYGDEIIDSWGYFAIMVSVGIHARKHATSVDGWVLGRSVASWLFGICVWYVITFQRLYL